MGENGGEKRTKKPVQVKLMFTKMVKMEMFSYAFVFAKHIMGWKN